MAFPRVFGAVFGAGLTDVKGTDRGLPRASAGPIIIQQSKTGERNMPGLTRAAIMVSLVLMPLTAPAAADTYPNRPVRIILGFGPGSSGDVVSRSVTAHMSQALGQQVVVESRTGAGSNVAAQFVARAPADGYTLLSGSNTNVANAVLQSNLAFDFVKDFAPIAPIGSLSNILVVHPSLGVSSVSELIVLAKSKPDQIFYGSAGIGSAPHLSAELFNVMAGTKLMHVPYQGSAQATTDLLAGRISLMFAPASTVKAHIDSGALKALATTQLKRTVYAPDLPTMVEAGLPGFDTGIWIGLLAPAATPRELVDKLAQAVNGALQSPEVVAALNRLGIDVMGGTPEQFAEFIANEMKKWSAVVEAAGLKK
jgi:tripartite-type tricarboxylate transporter receptor subunit TctC